MPKTPTKRSSHRSVLATPPSSSRRETRRSAADNHIAVPDFFFDLNKNPLLQRKVPSELEKAERRYQASLQTIKQECGEIVKDIGDTCFKCFDELEDVFDEIEEKRVERFYERSRGLRCRVCYELLWMPLVQTCGHTMCYGCLKTLAKIHMNKWGVETPEHMSCPECKVAHTGKPVLSYIVRDAVEQLASEMCETMPDDLPAMVWPPVFTP